MSGIKLAKDFQVKLKHKIPKNCFADSFFTSVSDYGLCIHYNDCNIKFQDKSCKFLSATKHKYIHKGEILLFTVIDKTKKMVYNIKNGGKAMDTNKKTKNVGNNMATADEIKKTPGMKWHKFLVGFALWAAAFFNLVNGIFQLTGIKYILNSYLSNVIMIRDELYFYYPPVFITDILFSVMLITAAIYQVITAVMLRKCKKSAPLHLNITTVIVCTAYALYDFLFAAFVRNEMYVRATINYSSASVTFIAALFIGTGLCIANWYYYKKRNYGKN